jgi:hypothetical protein
MIISKLMGGLGNQMFQYAFARNLSLKFNTPLKIDLLRLKKERKKVLILKQDLEEITI